MSDAAMTPPAKAERRWLGPTLLALVIAAALAALVAGPVSSVRW